MRQINAEDVTRKVKQLLIKANCEIGEDVLKALNDFKAKEPSDTGVNVLDQIIENNIIAKQEQVAICQDTGMAVVFVEFGQEVHIINGSFEDAVNEGVRQAYIDGYLRKSVVKDPIFDRSNTKDNTPAVIHTRIVEGDKLKISVTAKGFGSENMSSVKLFAPAAGLEGAKKYVLDVVSNAGPNSCPPMVVGVGIGGTFETACLIAKKALLRKIGEHNPDPNYARLEEELLNEVNKLGIGPAGLGGRTTALAVNVEFYPTHIASMPVAVNLCCHAARHAEGEL